MCGLSSDQNFLAVGESQLVQDGADCDKKCARLAQLDNGRYFDKDKADGSIDFGFCGM